MATATTDHGFIVRRAAGGRVLVLSGFASSAHSLAFNGKASMFAAGFADREVRLFDLTALRPVFNFRCDSHQIGFDASGTRLGPMLRGLEFGWLEFHPSHEFQQFNTGSTTVELDGCRFSPDGRLLVSGTLTNVLLSDAATGARLLQLRGFRLPAFAFDPRGEALFAAGTPGLQRWLLRWREPSFLEASPQEIVFRGAGWRAFTFSARGEWFAAANVRSNAAFLFDRSLTNLLVEVGPHPGADAVAVSPDGRWLATGSSSDRQVKVWEAGSGRERLTFSVGREPQVAFSADGKWLAAFGDSFHLFATASWQPAPLPFPEGAPVVGTAAFSSDGRLLAVVCDLQTIRLFDLLAWQPLGLLQAPGASRSTGLAFSPDGGLLAAAGDKARLRVWDLRRLRGRLEEFGLDWDLPPLPAPAATAQSVTRVTFMR